MRAANKIGINAAAASDRENRQGFILPLRHQLDALAAIGERAALADCAHLVRTGQELFELARER